VNKLELLRAIYNALQWDRLYQAMPEATRQQVDELFQELRQRLSQEAAPSEGPAVQEEPAPPIVPPEAVAGGEAWVYCDGASKGNPGPAAVGVVLTTPQGEEVLAWGAPIGRATNNVAEYRAVIEALKKALELKVRRVRILCDSELLIRQVQGAYKVKSPGLKALHAEAVGLLGRFERWEARHITRAQNAKADALAARHARPPRSDAR
jgi:ribonuclease HI